MPSRVAQLSCLFLVVLCTVVLPAADSQYTVKEGETLFAVARRAQVPVDILSAFNGIADAGKVKAGTVLKVPAAYTVKKGDTLYGIARALGIPVAKLLELNKLGQNARLRVGERLYIPQDTDTSTPRVADAAVRPQRSDVPAATDAVAPRAGGVIVWPHGGKHEPDNGKIPGLVFYGAPGDFVRSATAGEVKWAATYWTRGKVVIIKSVDGTLFTYGGNAELLVNVGDRVSPGTDIAKLGESAQGGGAKLYFSINDGSGRVVDPEKFFSAKSSS
jgi:murein DD-endopeptidase MepM/ murein hydrolase activator NlpD